MQIIPKLDTARRREAAAAAALASVSFCLLVGIEVLDARRIDDELGYYAPDISVAEVVRERGYNAEVHHFVTTDRYQLELTRASNPLVSKAVPGPKKLPLLFTHGTFMHGLIFVMNSRGVKPRLYDIDDRKLASMNVQELAKLVKNDPARRSLVFMALNFGYEAWILQRRGYVPGSRRKLGRKNRTLAEAVLEVPSILLGGGLGLSNGLARHRPARQPIELIKFTSINSTHLNEAQSFTLTDLLGLPWTNVWQSLQSLTKLPKMFTSAGNKRQRFIDTFDSDFWDYSMDEQAQYDLPECIDYVLKQTGAHKLHLVAFSCGSAIAMMALAEKPELANKISRAVMWAPSVNLGARKGNDYEASFVIPLIQAYAGPAPFLFLEYELKEAFQQLCNSRFVQKTLCEPILDLIFGPSGGQQPTQQYFFAAGPSPTNIREVFHLGQFAHTQRPCKFRFNTRAMNIAKYSGDGEPPCYDFSRILLRNMSLYAGTEDTMVTPNAVATTATQMRLPVELNVIGDENIRFSHIGNMVHEHNDRLIILPSLLDIARSQAQEPATARS